jgi:hypothetical protein
MGVGTAAGTAARASRRPTFVLVHSPLVGPSIWSWAGAALRRWGFDVVIPDMAGFENAGAPYWEPCVQAVVLACGDALGPLVLVGHGGAAPLLPAMTLALLGRVRRIAFVEASLPPLSGFAEPAPSWLRTRVASLSSGTRLPKWSEWLDEAAWHKLIPDPARRSVIESGLPELPLDYFDHVIPVPDRWAEEAPCSYLWFSNSHLSDARLAASRGWPVRHLTGSIVAMVTRPKTVARELSWAAAGLAH